MTEELPEVELLPVTTLEEYANSLRSLLETIAITRHEHIPNLIKNLQQPIQNQNQINNNRSITIDQLTQPWKTDSQNLVNDINSIRTQIINSQQIIKYARNSSKVDPIIDSEYKNSAIGRTAQIAEKIKLLHQSSSSSSKKRSSLSLASKSGIPIDKNLILTEVIKWKKLKNLTKNPSIVSKCFSITASSSSSEEEKEKNKNLNEIIDSVNKFNKEEDLITPISNNCIRLKNVMQVFLIFQANSQNSVIERVACFALNESFKSVYHLSSFSLIRSINRCINHTISQYLITNSSTSTTSDQKDNNVTTQNQQSNLVLFCSLLTSYKGFFNTELRNMRVKTPNPTGSVRGRMYIKRSRDPKLINNDHDSQTTSTIMNNNNLTNPSNILQRNLSTLQNPNKMIGRDGFLTWRRWNFAKDYLDTLVDSHPDTHQHDQMDIDIAPSSNLQLELDPIHVVLSRGSWIKIPEIH